MGWKGTMRSVIAANNRSIKEREREQKQLIKEQNKFYKKVQIIEERRDKIIQALKNDYAAGKINSDEYDRLSLRISDITYELLVFGKAAAVTLGKRYLCGKIEKEEFESLRNELVPAPVYKEMETISYKVDLIKSSITAFKESCKNTITTNCMKCEKQKSFFRSLHIIDNLRLCSSCTRAYKNIKTFDGFNGIYLLVQPCLINSDTEVDMIVRQEYL
ncbi:MAG: hypothetical protein ACK4EY_06055 [Flavipsychrobacter sp.]